MVTQTFATEGGAQFVLRPTRSLTWRQTKIFYGSIVAVTLVIAIGCTALGFWPVLPFAGLEVGALGIALWVVAERGTELEIVDIDAERVAVHAGSVMRVPDRLSWTEAAAVPEVFLTCDLNLFQLARAGEGGGGRRQRGEGGLGHERGSGCGPVFPRAYRRSGRRGYGTGGGRPVSWRVASEPTGGERAQAAESVRGREHGA